MLIWFPGAIFGVLNREDYRRGSFEHVGAAEAFLWTHLETVARLVWKIYAYILISNNFHLAMAAPKRSLTEGMHWLQSTLATRFNRFRGENGHLFQGRYKSLFVEDASVLGLFVDYIHLNPVRAKIVPPEHVKAYRRSSLRT